MANTFKNIKKKLRRKRLLAEKRHLEKAQAGAGGNEAARRKIKAALRRKKAVLKPVAVILIAVFVVLAGFLFLEKRTYRNYKVQVTSEQEDTVSTQYTYLSGKILRYSSDEVSLVNNKLETVWSQTYDMQNPVADVCGDCAVIADKDGTSMVFLDKNGITGTVSTSYSSVKAKVSKELKTVQVEQEIISTFYDEDNIGLVFKNDSKDKQYTMQVYSSAGKLKFSKDFNIPYTTIRMSDDYIVMYNSSQLCVLNSNGSEKYFGSVDGTVKDFFKLGWNKYLLVMDTGVNVIKLS